jgi:protein subunit release factor A
MHKIPDIAPFKEKLAELDAQMAEPNFYSDQHRAADVAREHQRLGTLIEKFEAYHSTVQQLNVMLARPQCTQAMISLV